MAGFWRHVTETATRGVGPERRNPRATGGVGTRLGPVAKTRGAPVAAARGPRTRAARCLRRLTPHGHAQAAEASTCGATAGPGCRGGRRLLAEGLPAYTTSVGWLGYPTRRCGGWPVRRWRRVDPLQEKVGDDQTRTARAAAASGDRAGPGAADGPNQPGPCPRRSRDARAAAFEPCGSRADQPRRRTRHLRSPPIAPSASPPQSTPTTA